MHFTKRHKKIFLIKLKRLMAMIMDGLGAFLLLIYALIVGPLGVLRGPIVLERAFWYISVLAPLGLLVRAVRVGIDWRLGHFSLAISQGESILRLVEEHRIKNQKSRTCKRVLIDFYTLLTRAHLHMGHIDDAMGVVIRAKRTLGKDYLSDLVGVDAKTAQLVRAGLSAGRMLEGDGLATLFVKSDPKPQPSIGSGSRQGASAEIKDEKSSSKTQKSNVLQFPVTKPSNNPQPPAE